MEVWFYPPVRGVRSVVLPAEPGRGAPIRPPNLDLAVKGPSASHRATWINPQHQVRALGPLSTRVDRPHALSNLEQARVLCMH